MRNAILFRALLSRLYWIKNSLIFRLVAAHNFQSSGICKSIAHNVFQLEIPPKKRRFYYFLLFAYCWMCVFVPLPNCLIDVTVTCKLKHVTRDFITHYKPSRSIQGLVRLECIIEAESNLFHMIVISDLPEQRKRKEGYRM